jgi:3'(2'), 5'-bisphosphate nucleotidase
VSNPALQLSNALVAARAAARAISQVGDPQAFSKGAAGPATVADLASQVAAAIALDELSGHDVRLVAEESWDDVERLGAASLMTTVAQAVSAGGTRCTPAECEAMLRRSHDPGGSGCFWAVDPLDGTKGYLRGGQFAIAIALIMHGHPVVGVVGAPRLGLRGTEPGPGVAFAAVRGRGAYQAPIAGDHEKIETIRCHEWVPGQTIRLAGSVEASHSAVDELEAAVASIGAMHAVRMDSQAKYGLVARGCADAYLRRSPKADYIEHIWDHAAGALIAEEAGCTVTDVEGKPLDFGKGRGLSANRGVICAAPALHAELLRTLGAPIR